MSEAGPLLERIRELEAANEALRRSEQLLSTELYTLQQVATQLVNAQGMQGLYERILDSAIAILRADFASIQMFYPERGTQGELLLLSHRGFSEEAAARWAWVSPATRTTCGEALRRGLRIAVSDVRKCAFMSGSEDLEGYLAAGIHAVQSTPLVSRSNVLLGMVSTHWRKPRELFVSELHALDILARLAADLIERSRAEETLRESEQRAMRELTERKHAEAALRDSEERFRRVFEDGPLGVALQGLDHCFLKVNSALCQMVGYTPSALLRMSFIDITHPDDVEMDVELAERLFRREIPSYRMQKRYVRKGGEIIWVNLTKSIIADGDDKPLYGITMVEDITEIKRTQNEAVARQKLESLGTLASGIAHDFNNLIGAIQAQAELAISELDEGASCREELQSIGDVAKRASEIVRQLMIYAGKEKQVVEPVSLSEIVEEMLPLLKVSSKHATMIADLGRDLPAIRASAAQLRQVVMNLITNASEAIGDRDGVIRVTTRRATSGNGAAPVPDTLPAGDCLALEVTDTGCGMSQEMLAKVFDPFFTTKSAGRGLGLPVVSGIVRGLGGEVRIASEQGKGTTFHVLLPCAETKAGTQNDLIAGCEESGRPLRECTVLVVEDEAPLRQAVVKKLSATGFAVLEAGDGSAAMDLLRENADKIDVILLDMTIPGAPSAQIVAEAAQTRPEIRVILTSAYSQEMLTEPLHASQIRGFIRKPFRLGDLVKTLCSAASAA
jgi:PAS domain S-box-containing protein